VISSILVVALAQQNTTPVPILKQINRHNEDGSYSYGYEAADGSYKIESKYPNGEVYGKYGFVDDQGKLREIEYGATRRGFEPAGNEINVPPPTVNVDNNVSPLAPGQEDDGQYREDPSIYYKDEKYNNNNNVNSNVKATPYSFNYQAPAQPTQKPYYQQSAYQQPAYQQQNYQQPAYQQPAYQQPAYQQPAYQQPAYQQHRFQPAQTYNQVQPSYFNPAHPNFNPFGGHPAQNLDLSSGSYSVSYKR